MRTENVDAACICLTEPVAISLSPNGGEGDDREGGCGAGLQIDPRAARAVGGLERRDLRLAAQGQGDLVEPLQQRLAAAPVDREGDLAAVRGGDPAALKIDGERRARGGGSLFGERRHPVRRQHHRQQGVGEAVVEEDGAEAGCDDATDADAEDRFIRLRAEALILAELCNINAFRAEEDDYRAWAAEARDISLKAAEAAAKRDVDAAKALAREIKTKCRACHDKYQD